MVTSTSLPSWARGRSVLRCGCRGATLTIRQQLGRGSTSTCGVSYPGGIPAVHQRHRYILAEQHPGREEKMKASFSTIPMSGQLKMGSCSTDFRLGTKQVKTAGFHVQNNLQAYITLRLFQMKAILSRAYSDYKVVCFSAHKIRQTA